MLTTTKPPRCKFCRQRTEGERIHPACVDAWWTAYNAKQQAKKVQAEKAKDRATREKQKPLRDLLAEAQTAFNQWVRTRDAHQPCISCGETDPPMKPGGAWDAGHFLSRGAYPELRFDEDNCHKQCKTCNGGGGKFAHKARTVAAEYEERLIERIGPERVERLKGPHELVKWDRDVLRQIKTIYRAKTRELRKEKA
jgi:hypothetical protein